MSSSGTLSQALDNEATTDTPEDERDLAASDEQPEEAPMKWLRAVFQVSRSVLCRVGY
jgi:hypothetical protein